MDPLFTLEPEAARPTKAVVHLDTLARNARAIIEHTRSELLAVVKADAYGHGAVPCATRLVQAGASMLGVACAEEALELRQAGIQHPILVLGRTLPAAMPLLVRHHITCTLTCPEDATALHAAARAQNDCALAHVKLDSGMSRLGLQAEAIPAFWELLESLPALKIQGLFTHLAAADDPAPEAIAFTRMQLACFTRVARSLKARSPQLRLHCCASSGTHSLPDGFCDMVRPGLSLYGGRSASGQPAYTVEPVMSLHSAIVALNTFPSGRAVSYGCSFVCKSPRRIAVVPCGYADGLPRALSNKGHALVYQSGKADGSARLSGRTAPFAGRVCMDMVMLDVTDIPDAAVGSPVVFFGNPSLEGPLCPTLDTVAAQIHAIAYELTCGISRRVPRVYESLC